MNLESLEETRSNLQTLEFEVDPENNGRPLESFMYERM